MKYINLQHQTNISNMCNKTLPQEIKVEDVTYSLEEEHYGDDAGDFAGWTCYRYINNNESFPIPSIAIEGYIEYMVSMYPDAQDAFDDMMRKVTKGDLTKNYNSIGIKD